MLKDFKIWKTVYDEESITSDKRGGFGLLLNWTFTISDVHDILYQEFDEFINLRFCLGINEKMKASRKRAVAWFEENNIFASHIRLAEIKDIQQKIATKGDCLYLYLEIGQDGYRTFVLVRGLPESDRFLPVWKCPTDALRRFAEACWWPVFQNWKEIQRKALHDMKLNRQDMEPAINLLDNFDK